MHKVPEPSPRALSEGEVAFLTRLAKGNALTNAKGRQPARRAFPTADDHLTALLSRLGALFSALGAARPRASGADGAQRE